MATRPFFLALSGGLCSAILIHPAPVPADTISDNLPDDAGAVDVHSVDCPGGSYLLSTKIRNTTESAPLLSTQSVKGKKATNTTDPVSGDTNYSPSAYNVGGSGNYAVTVTKSGRGTVDYTLDYSCRTLSEVLASGLLSVTPPQVRNEAREGQTTSHDLLIGQGCQTATFSPGGSFKTNPVVAESVLFPTATSTGIRSDNGQQIPLNEVISNEKGLAGSVALIQDQSIFRRHDLKLDDSGNTIGFQGIRGKLDTDLIGRVPFTFTAPSFVPSSCANRLLVKIAVADICKARGKPDLGTVNLWIPGTTARFPNSLLILGSDGSPRSGLPATLVINRADPVQPSCGAGYDVTLWPGDEQIDALLPIRGYWQP